MQTVVPGSLGTGPGEVDESKPERFQAMEAVRYHTLLDRSAVLPAEWDIAILSS